MVKFIFILVVLSFQSLNAQQLNKIIIDAGHGGVDFGCNGEYVYEKDINLAISLKLGELIEKHIKDIKVLYTRRNDVTLNLCDRAISANFVNADLFISIHCNANINSSASGAEIFIQNMNLTPLELATAQNNSTNSEYNEEESLNCPKNDISTTKMIKAVSIAIKIERNFKNLGLRTRGINKENFMILRKTKMSSILIECGFLTNSYEEKFLMSDSGQLQIATAILKGILEYKKGMN